MLQSFSFAPLLFAVAAAFTPGPNNTMLLASGLNFGFRRTIPHVLGIVVGCGIVMLVAGFGLGAVFATYPLVYTILKYVGAAYLLYLAYRIVIAGGVEGTDEKKGKPLSFIGAALFQWVNVKGLVAAISGVTIYSAIAPYPYNVLLLALIFGLVTLAATTAWALFGVGLRRVLSTPRAVRVFNAIMAALLVASLYPVLAG